jgi:hypothetical protein
MDDKNYKMDITLHNNVKDYLLNKVKLAITNGPNTLDISLLNCGDSAVHLDRLDIHLATFRFDKKSVCVLNSEEPSKDIEFQPLEESKTSKEFASYLFGMVLEEIFSSNYLFAFLCTHKSKNFIKYIVEGDCVKVYAVYNFGAHKLLQNETLKLDTMYMEEGNNPFSSFNNYIDAITNNYEYNQLAESNTNKSLIGNKGKQYNLLFTEKPCSYSIKVNNKPVSVKVDKERMYPVDIASDNGKSVIFERVQQLKNRNGGIIYFKYVNNYLEEVLKLKASNPYFELNNLLLVLRQEFEDIKFYFDDCPLGMAIGNNAILEQELELNKKHGVLEKLLKKKEKYSLNYNFIIKMMLKRSISNYGTRFNINNSKVRALFEAITGGLAAKTEADILLRTISEDIDTKFGVIPYLQSKDIFGFVAKGKETVYMAVFNLSENPVRFYCDLSMQMEHINLDGVVNEVFTDTNYLVSDGKLYIRNFPAMDCCLFKKIIA